MKQEDIERIVKITTDVYVECDAVVEKILNAMEGTGYRFPSGERESFKIYLVDLAVKGVLGM